jgi:hypothetical protein
MNNTSFAQPAKSPATGIELTGRMNFDVKFLDTDFLADFAPGCPATAALVQVSKEEYELRLFEGGPCGNRMSIWELTIDKAGNVTGEAWARMINPPAETGSMLGQWWLHTGCKMTGVDPLFPGITGSWDGTTLIADARAEGYCDGGTMWAGPALGSTIMDVETENEGRLAHGVSWEDGPVHVRFGAELTAVE